jgi:hypothetical protein
MVEEYIVCHSRDRSECEKKYKKSVLINKGINKTIYEACLEDDCRYVVKIFTYYKDDHLTRDYYLERWKMEVTGYSRILNCEKRYNVFTQETQFVPKLYDSWYCDDERGNTRFYLVMEKYDGNLIHFMKKYKYNRLVNTVVQQSLSNLTSALYFINNNCGICLNDIKLEHILYKYRGNGYYDFSFGDLGKSSIASSQECKEDILRFDQTIKIFLNHLDEPLNLIFNDKNIMEDDIFYYSNYPELLGPKLGGGMYGSVFVDDTDPHSCIKMTNKNNKNYKNYCQKWKNEYQMIKNIYQSVKDREEYKKIDYVKIVIPTVFEETGSICYMKIPRIYRPLLPNEKPESEFITLQVQLGLPNIQKIRNNQGEFIGLEQIKKYINDLQSRQSCFELGMMMGLIHYVGRQTALDIEIFLGSEYRSNKICFYIADFDMSKQIQSFDNLTIQEMIASLSDKPYFPRKTSDQHLFDLFYQGYSSIVPKEICDKVFEGY